jgi:hypothetical protein
VLFVSGWRCVVAVCFAGNGQESVLVAEVFQPLSHKMTILERVNSVPGLSCNRDWLIAGTRTRLIPALQFAGHVGNLPTRARLRCNPSSSLSCTNQCFRIRNSVASDGTSNEFLANSVWWLARYPYPVGCCRYKDLTYLPTHHACSLSTWLTFSCTKAKENPLP